MICYFSIADQRTLSKEARAHWMARACLGFGAESMSKCLQIWTMRETRTTIRLEQELKISNLRQELLHSVFPFHELCFLFSAVPLL